MGPGALIKQIRRQAGLSQTELAARAGTSQPVISAYEHGDREPSISTLGRVVAAAGQRLVIDAVADERSTAAWSPEDHGRRLADVLSLADAIPARRRASLLSAPRMVSQ